MRFEAAYAFDMSEFGSECPVIRIKCRSDKKPNGVWICSFETTNEIPLTPREIKAIKKAVHPLFEGDFKEAYADVNNLEWEGEKKRHPLLQFKAGDVVKYSGENHEVIYVIPETEKCGIKNKEGKLLNNIKFSEIQGVLLKRN